MPLQHRSLIDFQYGIEAMGIHFFLILWRFLAFESKNAGTNVLAKLTLFVAFPWVETSTGPGGFMICVFINMTGTAEGSTESGFME